MHAWCVQGTPDVNALADTIALNGLKSNLAFLPDTVVFLVSSLEHHIGRDKLVKLILITKHMNRAARVNDTRFKVHVVRNARAKEMGLLIVQTDRPKECFAAERLVFYIRRS